MEFNQDQPRSGWLDVPHLGPGPLLTPCPAPRALQPWRRLLLQAEGWWGSRSTGKEGARSRSGCTAPHRGKRSAETEAGEVGWLGFPFLGSDTVNIQKRQMAWFISKDRSTCQRSINDLAKCPCLPTIRGRRRRRADCGHSRHGHGHGPLCSHIWLTDLIDLAGESQSQGEGKAPFIKCKALYFQKVAYSREGGD